MPKGAFRGKKTKRLTAQELQQVMFEAFNLVQALSSRLIIPDDFLPDHPDREKMVVYLKTKSWKGTESGAAMSARVPLSIIREWREIQEFVDWEELADLASKELSEEMARLYGISSGDKSLLLADLKARDPDRWSDRQEITGPKGAPLEFVVNLGTVPRPTRLD